MGKSWFRHFGLLPFFSSNEIFSPESLHMMRWGHGWWIYPKLSVRNGQGLTLVQESHLSLHWIFSSLAQSFPPPPSPAPASWWSGTHDGSSALFILRRCLKKITFCSFVFVFGGSGGMDLSEPCLKLTKLWTQTPNNGPSSFQISRNPPWLCQQIIWHVAVIYDLV